MIEESFLHETGVFEGLTTEEQAAFLTLCRGELDKRVGAALTDIMTAEQIETFEEMMRDGADGAKKAVAWITETVPGYQGIVLKTLGELKADIINNREEILN